ncbi:MAG: bifunctional phosphopantothenoylcysteine decarboxylase/phosphopantothenate--cysteine ligase CoaBC [Ignavibacteriales bacterium]|nr:bifunctional phosphopantothenoylcysteine decarboxylase/phosphopantothenate--cysteine ligase CoaBC [Ignavibacteriales bacterium]
MLKGKHIALGVTGGIAAYKCCYLVREMKRAGADVKVIMTHSATKFVTPMTFSALSGHDVYTDLWMTNQDTKSDIGTRHIDLAQWADILLIAPASANSVAKLTHGLADNFLTVVALACTRPIVLAPTMDADMFLSEITQKNLSLLRERGYFVIPSPEGEHASGLKGPGRLPDIEPIIAFVEDVLRKTNQDLQKKHILVTAGPTYEAIDPVRFIGNRSSGKMGFAIANAAALRGARVTLVSGPVALETPRNVERINVESAQQMHEAVAARAKKADAIIMAAAVADFAPEKQAKNKIKKNGATSIPELKLAPTVDILESVGKTKNGHVVVGFALETENELSNAKAKVRKKNMDLVVLNSLRESADVFGSDANAVTFIDKKGKVQKLPKLSKFDVANEILDRVKKLL